MSVIEKGPPTGEQHHGRDILAWIGTEDGSRWAFNRRAVEARGGGVELSQLRHDECVIAPGLIYRRNQH